MNSLSIGKEKNGYWKSQGSVPSEGTEGRGSTLEPQGVTGI